MISKILVPVDGSKSSQKAAAYAVGLAKQLRASLIILSVVDARMFTSHAVPAVKTARHIDETVEDYLNEVAESCVEAVKKLCDKRGVASRSFIKRGYPVEEIITQAGKAKANLIVMGSRGRSTFSATVLGSVSYGVLHGDKNIPVLIVRE